MNMDIELPKWCGHLVKGEPVSEEEAAEIIIRTNSYISDHDEIGKEIWKTFGYSPKVRTIKRSDGSTYQFNEYPHAQIREDFQQLNLSYIDNERIISHWIGGPNGWCNWDGTIFQANKNVGKWPDCEAIYEDWCKVAEAFPFLNLRSQILPCEMYTLIENSPGILPVIEFQVKNGKVSVVKPTDLCVFPRDVEFYHTRFSLQNLDQLREKIAIVKHRLKNKEN
jgi:hypothetical protein